MSGFVRKPLWYKDAVIYEAHVKGFRDSDGDGIGDFRGLIERLDYIRDLGVNAIWLLPFYPSPLRDDGYDIADYRDVHPSYGTLEAFQEFLEAAHARDIHVITEVVINHTSDRHPWFQRARRAPPGSPERDFYVWSNSKDRYSQARIIFKDYEPSNWTWDPVAKAHYWHRFYHHQPDLNFDNPAVHDAVLSILDFWLGMGVDGLRLDAIPYLYEREGTNCENLPETHAFLRKLSRHVRENYDNRMLLAEANQWPEDAVAYFGGGEACDMAFHFPLMTRLYMALETEDTFPVTDIMEQTPPIPGNCQWAIFLRNHDELTLEMVTDEERDYMYRAYAKDRRARINLGIRRRLAPLLGNNRRKIELLNGLLLSLPGTPVIYYGDEIGMGDNIYLGDRDGVRTPMQWSADRNAGFSAAPAQRLYLPVIRDTEHDYVAVNVEAQESNPDSLLWWMRRRIHQRRAHPVFGRGGIRFLQAGNARVLAFVREHDGEAVLVLANLSRHPQAAHLDLSEWRGSEPEELGGGGRFPVIGADPWPVMLGSHDCLWLRLRGAGNPVAEVRDLPDAGESDDLAGLVSADAAVRTSLESHVVHAPWFTGRARPLVRVTPVPEARGRAPVDGFGEHVHVLLRAEFLQGEAETYSLWIGFAPRDALADLPAHACIATARVGGVDGVLCEAQHLPAFRDALARRMLHPGGWVARLPSVPDTALDAALPPPRARLGLEDEDPEEFRITAQGHVLVRWFRRVREEGRTDLDLLRHLKALSPKARVPLCLTHVASSAGTLGFAQRLPGRHRTLLDLARESQEHFLQEAAAAPVPPRVEHAGEQVPVLPGGVPTRLPARMDFQTLDPGLQAWIGGPWSEFVVLLGRRLAELHRILARSAREDAVFGPEPITLLHQHSLYHSIRGRLRRALARPQFLASLLTEETRMLAARAASIEPVLLERLKRLVAGRIDGMRLRVHGDPRLDRILFTGKDFVFTGFDGPPWLAWPERAFRYSPLHDVAALLRELFRLAGGAEDGTPARRWSELSAGLFLDGYLDTVETERWMTSTPSARAMLLEAFLIERLAHEVQGAATDPVRASDALRELCRLGEGNGQ